MLIQFPSLVMPQSWGRGLLTLILWFLFILLLLNLHDHSSVQNLTSCMTETLVIVSSDTPIFNTLLQQEWEEGSFALPP